MKRNPKPALGGYKQLCGRGAATIASKGGVLMMGRRSARIRNLLNWQIKPSNAGESPP